MIGRRSTDLGLYADNDDRGRAVELLRSQGFVRDFDIRIRKKSGELRLTSLSIERLDISGEECMITTVQDITDRRRAEEAVRESERFALNTVNAPGREHRHPGRRGRGHIREPLVARLRPGQRRG